MVPISQSLPTAISNDSRAMSTEVALSSNRLTALQPVDAGPGIYAQANSSTAKRCMRQSDKVNTNIFARIGNAISRGVARLGGSCFSAGSMDARTVSKESAPPVSPQDLQPPPARIQQDRLFSENIYTLQPHRVEFLKQPISQKAFEQLCADPANASKTMFVTLKSKILSQAPELPTHIVVNDKVGNQQVVAMETILARSCMSPTVIGRIIQSLESALQRISSDPDLAPMQVFSGLKSVHSLVNTCADSPAINIKDPLDYFTPTQCEVALGGSNYAVADAKTGREILTMKPTMLGLEALVAHASRKEGVSIETFNFQAQPELLHDTLISKLETLAPNTAQGMVVIHADEGHVTPLLLARSAKGAGSLIALDSVGGRFANREGFLEPLNFKRAEAFARTIEQVATTLQENSAFGTPSAGLAVYQNIKTWQTDNVSCRIDSVVLLKDALSNFKTQGVDAVLDMFARQAQISVKPSSTNIDGARFITLPTLWSKIIQSPKYETFGNEGLLTSAKHGTKSAQARQEKYTREVKLTPTGVFDILSDESVLTKNINLANIHKSYKLASDVLAQL